MSALFLFGIPGGPEMILIFFVVLLLFGGRKIPELMRGLGKGIREFNTARASIEGEIREGMRAEERAEKEKDREKAEIRIEKSTEGAYSRTLFIVAHQVVAFYQAHELVPVGGVGRVAGLA